MEKQIEARQSSAEGAGDGIEGVTRSKVRNVAFKGLVILFSLVLIAGFNLLFVLFAVTWLPDATYLAILDEGPAQLAHRVHASILPLVVWIILIGVVVQLRRPEDRLAPLLMALVVPIIGNLVDVTIGLFEFGASQIPVIFVVLIALLHPRARELVRIPRLNGLMAGLTAAAAAAWIPFAYGQAQLQLLAVPGDPHAEMEHWKLMAQFALILVVWALIGASDYRGWRITAWVAGLGSAWYGLQSLLFPSASAAALPWAIAAVGWGIAYIFVAERRARAAQREQQSKLAAQPG